MPKDDKKNKTKAQESQLKKAASSNNSVKSNAKDPQASDKKQKQRFYYDPIIEAKQPASSKASVKNAQGSQLKKAASAKKSVKSNDKDPQASDKKEKQRFYYDPIIEAKQPASSKASVKKDSQAKKKLPDEIILGLKLEKVGKEIQEEQARRKKAGEKSKSNLQLLIEKMEEEILAEEK